MHRNCGEVKDHCPILLSRFCFRAKDDYPYATSAKAVNFRSDDEKLLRRRALCPLAAILLSYQPQNRNWCLPERRVASLSISRRQSLHCLRTWLAPVLHFHSRLENISRSSSRNNFLQGDFSTLATVWIAIHRTISRFSSIRSIRRKLESQ